MTSVPSSFHVQLIADVMLAPLAGSRNTNSEWVSGSLMLELRVLSPSIELGLAQPEYMCTFSGV